MADYIPMDIQAKILLKLPVKPLICFTTVCKSWLSLIKSPFFIASYLSESKKENSVLLVRYDIHQSEQYYSFLNVIENKPFRIHSSPELKFPYPVADTMSCIIVGVCNGIVCALDNEYQFKDQLSPIILWNPAIKTHVVLPEGVVNLKSSDYIILGFGVSQDDYKVVRFIVHEKYLGSAVFHSYHIPPEVEIFSLKTGCWRKFEAFDLKVKLYDYNTYGSVFLNGNVHWLAYEEEKLQNRRECCSILAFNIADETFHQLKLPDELAKVYPGSMSLLSNVESLVVGKYDNEYVSASFCDVWQMKDYGVKDSWVRLYRIDLVGGIGQVLAFLKNGEVLVSSLGATQQGDGELVAYNQETKQTTELGIHSMAHSYAFNYVESLVLLEDNLKLQKVSDMQFMG